VTAGKRTDPVESAGDPVVALRRIAFLLERTREETYKVKAFRAAASTLLKLSPDEVRTRAEQGTLRELPGIGTSTEKVVREAVAGQTPSYLRRLEETAGPLADSGRELRGRLRGDLHTHSDWSDGGSPSRDGDDRDGSGTVLALTDLPRLTVATVSHGRCAAARRGGAVNAPRRRLRM
jgi:putative hydrolase